jgi:hypothetical protein
VAAPVLDTVVFCVVVSEPVPLLTWLVVWDLLPEQAARTNIHNSVVMDAIFFFIVKSPEYAFLKLSLPSVLIV